MIPKRGISDITDNGASFLAATHYMLYLWLIDNRLGWPNMIRTSESALSLVSAFKVRLELR